MPKLFCCYTPWNLQTQRLTCADSGRPAEVEWTAGARVDDSSTWPSATDGGKLSPVLNVTLALENARSARFVGLVEAYQVRVRISGSPNPNPKPNPSPSPSPKPNPNPNPNPSQESVCLFAATTAGVDALPAFCDCEDAEAWGQFVSVDATHGRYTHPTPDALPAEVLERIDAMTADDRAVYAAMVARFVEDLEAVERASGRRILCEATRRRLGPASRSSDEQP